MGSCDKMVVVFSGFRDDQLIAQIEAEGGHVAGSLVKNATHILVKADGKPSAKIAEAEAKGLIRLDLNEFIEEHGFTLKPKAERKPRASTDSVEGEKVKISKVVTADDSENETNHDDEEKKPKAQRKPKAKKEDSVVESDIELLAKITHTLATKKSKQEALHALIALTARVEQMKK